MIGPVWVETLSKDPAVAIEVSLYDLQSTARGLACCGQGSLENFLRARSSLNRGHGRKIERRPTSRFTSHATDHLLVDQKPCLKLLNRNDRYTPTYSPDRAECIQDLISDGSSIAGVSVAVNEHKVDIRVDVEYRPQLVINAVPRG